MRRSIITLAFLGFACVLSAASLSAADPGLQQAQPVDVDRVPLELFTRSQVSSPGGQLLPVDNTTFWSKESLPGGTAGRYRVMSCVAPDSNIFYVMGGQAPSAVATAYRYNILTNTWSTIAPMPGANANQMAAFWVDNGGGTDSSGIFVVCRYSPTYARTSYRWRRATNTWDTIPWPPGPTTSTYQAGTMCAVVGDSLYFMARTSASVCSLWRYSIRQGTWASIGQVPGYAYYGAMTTYGGKIWQIGSYPISPALPTALLCYDPPTRTWLSKASPSWADSAGGNSTHLVGIPGGKLVLYGGGDGWYPRRGINVYDTTANTWSPEMDRLPQPDLGGGYGAVDSAGTVGIHLACGEINYPSPILNVNMHWRGRYIPPPPNDVKLDAILAPTRFEQGVSVTPIVRIRNTGTAAQTSVPVYVTADSAGTLIYSANTTWTGTLNPGDTARVTFTTGFPVGARGLLYGVTSWTALAGDQNPSNDTARFTGTVVGVPNRYFKQEWSWNSPRTTGGCYGVTGVQDSLVWVNLGYLAPFKTYILRFSDQAVLDSFTQYATGSYGYFDMTYIPAENAVYAGTSVTNRMDKINGTTKALISSYILTGSPYNNWLLSMAHDGDSLYSSYFNTYGVYKFSVTGTNARRVLTAFPGTIVPFGLGYDDNKGTMYGFDGSYTGGIVQYGMPDFAHLLDTTLAGPGPGALFSGGEVFKDTFLLFTQQAPTLTTWCYRIIPKELDYGVAAIVSPTGQVDTNEVVIPGARWQNYHALQSGTFTAYYSLENPSGTRVYTESRTITGLLAGEDTLLYFLPYNVGMDTGTWTVRCSTYADGDNTPANDVLESTFRVVLSSQPPPPGGWTEIA
ncbi:MAG: kelch repeat-containing protein, partial [bacterium]